MEVRCRYHRFAITLPPLDSSSTKSCFRFCFFFLSLLLLLFPPPQRCSTLPSAVLHSARVEAALRRVDRSNFVLHRDQAYVDQPQPIGHGQTISAPHMHVMCLEALEDKLLPGSRVLDVGSGSGYLTAAMGHMVGENGKVIGIEYVEELVELGKQNLRKDSPELLEKGIVEIKSKQCNRKITNGTIV
ncbi:Protein-L-isoaspartate(D-aspartate) O-methyltransferase, variant 2 [Balamuthia mandrillaris]